MLSRRVVVGSIAALAAACARRAPPGATTLAPRAGDLPETDWAAVRELFPLARDWVHLTSFLLASHPRPVAEAIDRYRRELDANPALVMESELESYEHTSRARAAAARYVGGRPDEIALTDSTTMGLGTLYVGLRLGPSDEILTTAHDHYSTHESLRLAAARTGARIRTVPMYEHGAKATVEGMTRAIADALTPRTRVVAITWVHSSTGVRTPVRSIAEAIARSRTSPRPLLCVDGVHGFGVEDVSVADLGCDFFVSGCHKWLYGPRGTGIVWGRAEAWRGLLPTIPPFFGRWWIAREFGAPPQPPRSVAGLRPTPGELGRDVPPVDGWVMSPGGFKAFEHQWAIADAFEMHERIGRARIAARIHELARHAKEGLAKMRHVTLHTPASDAVSSGMICFEVAGMEPAAVVERLLARRVIASVSPYRPPLARIATSLVNDHADVEAALEAIRALA